MLTIGTMILLSVGVFIILVLLHLRHNKKIHILEKAKLKSAFDNQLLQARLETQEQSFQYFSEEIHDNVGQVLTVVGMHIYQLQAECKGDRAQKLAQQSSDLLNKAIEDLRTISHTLNAQYISKAGLIESLNQEVAYINSVKDVTCRLDIQGEPDDLPADRQTLLYRIIQEAMSNALKHARATEIIISLRFESGILHTAITDNGKGLELAAIKGAKVGLGLTNMQLRAGLLGGELLIQSTPDQGTTLALSLTITPATT